MEKTDHEYPEQTRNQTLDGQAQERPCTGHHSGQGRVEEDGRGDVVNVLHGKAHGILDRMQAIY